MMDLHTTSSKISKKSKLRLCSPQPTRAWAVLAGHPIHMPASKRRPSLPLVPSPPRKTSPEVDINQSSNLRLPSLAPPVARQISPEGRIPHLSELELPTLAPLLARQASPEVQISRLSDFSIPSQNPFVKAARASLATQGLVSKIQKNRFGEESWMIVKPTPLKTASDYDCFNATLSPTCDNMTIPQMCATYYAVHHNLSDNEFTSLIPKSHPERIIKSELSQIDIRYIKQWEHRFQSLIQAILLKGVKELVGTMGGLPVWQTATVNDRMAVFEAVFRSQPRLTTQAYLGRISYAVPVQDIFSDNTPTHRKWQTLHSTVFTWACHDVYTHRVASKEDQKDVCFRKWRHMTKWLDVGGRDQIPVKWGIWALGPLATSSVEPLRAMIPAAIASMKNRQRSDNLSYSRKMEGANGVTIGLQY